MVAYRFFLVAAYTVYIGATPIHAGWFSSHKYEQEELLELIPKQKQCSLSIDHDIPGSIHLKGWQQEHVAVTVHKKAHSADDAERLHCTLTQTAHGVISLHVQASDALHKHGAV